MLLFGSDVNPNGKKTSRPFGIQSELLAVSVAFRCKKALQSRRAFCVDARRGLRLNALFRRGWGEPFAFAAGFWFRLGLRSFLDFFLAFVFASHACKCDTTGVRRGRLNAASGRRVPPRASPLIEYGACSGGVQGRVRITLIAGRSTPEYLSWYRSRRRTWWH